jgi:two-component system, chemotaxis family, chemotaxis protein CheY
MFDPKTKILVVDDMLTMRKIVAKNLKELGFTEIVDAADGNLAWTAMEQANPPFALVISDWNMPNCTGLALLKKVRADARFAKIPFVLLTAEAEASQVKEALMSGATNYILKPFTADILKLKLEQSHKKVMGS